MSEPNQSDEMNIFLEQTLTQLKSQLTKEEILEVLNQLPFDEQIKLFEQLGYELDPDV